MSAAPHSPEEPRTAPSVPNTAGARAPATAPRHAAEGLRLDSSLAAVVGPSDLERALAIVRAAEQTSWIDVAPASLVSAAVHGVLLLLAAFLMMPGRSMEQLRELVLTTSEVVETPLETSGFVDQPPAALESTSAAESLSIVTDAVAVDAVLDVAASDAAAAPSAVALDPLGLEQAPRTDLLGSIGAMTGQGFSSRTPVGRQAAVVSRGGTTASEKAVGAALDWLTKHQATDGGWNFDHRGGVCQGRCKQHGELSKARIAATSMALLPFLGAGQTHLDGAHKATVERGLLFLGQQMRVSPNGGDLSESGGSMYSHGLASIVLCEAYGMTQDRRLLAPSQLALNYIVAAQDPRGGGWRYSPQPAGGGDTSVVGWQLMALKSGHMSYLQAPPLSIRGAENFLNRVQFDDGARYGYMSSNDRPDANNLTMTAVGLLCRMYLGWDREHPALRRGVEMLSKAGPSGTDLYYNYYATQVLHHYEGEMWEKWNKRMRDGLVAGQSTEGHEAGSWYVADGHGAGPGGRLYCTSLAALTLEVYYRHLPLYTKETTEDDFLE